MIPKTRARLARQYEGVSKLVVKMIVNAMAGGKFLHRVEHRCVCLSGTVVILPRLRPPAQSENRNTDIPSDAPITVAENAKFVSSCDQSELVIARDKRKS